jgi:Vitamin B12 dependent methionine synthase, activation domain.
MKLENLIFYASVFSKLSAKKIHWVTPYILTIGIHVSPSNRPLDFFYTDAWGTAYIDAARDALKEHVVRIARQKGLFTSESIAPGFYGMPLGQNKLFFELLDGDVCGVSLSAGGHLVPPKSCTGLFLHSQDTAIHLPVGCASCIGGKAGCTYCQISKY